MSRIKGYFLFRASILLICLTVISSCGDDTGSDPMFGSDQRVVLAYSEGGGLTNSHAFTYNGSGKLIMNEVTQTFGGNTGISSETHTYSGDILTTEQVQSAGGFTQKTLRREQTIVSGLNMLTIDYTYFGEDTPELFSTTTYTYNGDKLLEREKYSDFSENVEEHDYYTYNGDKIVKWEGYDYDFYDEQLELADSYDDFVYDGSRLKEFTIYTHSNNGTTAEISGKWVFGHDNTGRVDEVITYDYDNGSFVNESVLVMAQYNSEGYVSRLSSLGLVTNYTYEEGLGNLRSIVPPQQLLFGYPATARISSNQTAGNPDAYILGGIFGL